MTYKYADIYVIGILYSHFDSAMNCYKLYNTVRIAHSRLLQQQYKLIHYNTTNNLRHIHTASPLSSLLCPSYNNTTTSYECMNRNKRKVNPANHGARPCNSVGRKSRMLYTKKSWSLAERPNQTHNKVSPYISQTRIDKEQDKIKLKQKWADKEKVKQQWIEYGQLVAQQKLGLIDSKQVIKPPPI